MHQTQMYIFSSVRRPVSTKSTEALLCMHIVARSAYACKSLVPISKTMMTERDMWFVDKRMPRFLFWFIKEQARQGFEDDFLLWENKICLKNPLVVSGDGMIMKRRRWMKRFFVSAMAGDHVNGNNPSPSTTATPNKEHDSEHLQPLQW